MLDIDICNLALSYINKRPITSFDDKTAEAMHCKIQYHTTRKQLLCEHLWGFAETYVDLSLASEDAGFGFELSYLLPPLCLRVDKVLDSLSEPVRYLVAMNPLQQQRIYTDEYDASARYTQDVTNANIFSPLFTQALARLLAANMSVSLMGTAKGLTQYLMSLYRSDVAAAQARDSNGQYEGEMVENPYVTARE